MQKLTVIMEGYLENIYALCEQNGRARVTDIAAKMAVTKATVNRAVSVLHEMGLVEGARYREVRITEEGRRLARWICGKHEVIELFLIRVLHVDPADAEKDACAIEHIMSDASLLAIRRYLREHNIK
ncbi:MAG: metal-dependent transcriptional regulator [Oscillospiraceae bacterium]|jgi:Mn-dependent DtxR family transcriptional regulator|nr:metal-dependent transcriptional regulator [Oscillospiraceae bacterium]